MTPKADITSKMVLAYIKPLLKAGQRPSLIEIGTKFNVSPTTARNMVQELVYSGKLIRRSHLLYLPGEHILLDQRGLVNTNASRIKSEGGRKGAMTLKRMAFEKGVHFSALDRVPSKDWDDIMSRIDEIGTRAEGAGTCYRPNMVSIHGMKRG